MKVGNKFYLICSLIIIFLLYFRWFLPFPHISNDLHVTSQTELKNQLALPSVWGNEGAVGLGEYSAFVIWNWPIEVLFGFLGALGLSHNFINQFFALMLGLVVGFLGVVNVLKKYDLNVFGQCAGGFFYLTTTYFILLVDGGQLSIALAYLYFPIAYFSITYAINKSFSVRIVSALVVALIVTFDIRFVYILAILIALKALFDVYFSKKRKKLQVFLKWIKQGVLIGIITLLLNVYWILPALIAGGDALPPTYSRVTQTSFLDFTKLGHALFLQQPHWYKNVFGRVSDLNVQFVVFPILVFLAPVYVRKNKHIAFWLIVALIGIFLTKGASDPLSNAYNLLFTKVPGFSLFRDSTKFFILVAFAYSILIAFTIDLFTKKLRDLKREDYFSIFSPLGPGLILFLVWVYISLLIRPVWSGKMTGTFSYPIYRSEFEKTNRIIETDKNFGRVLWISTKAPLGYSSPLHPSVEALRLFNTRPFATSVVGSYETFNFLREGKAMGEIFDVFGIKYIGYPFPDERREELKQDNIDYYHGFLDQLASLPWIEQKLTEPPVPLLKTNGSANHFFVTDNTFLVVGSDSIYNDLIKIPEFKLNRNAVYFAEERLGLAKSVIDKTNANIIFLNKNVIDLAASLVPAENFIFPSVGLETSPNKTGWWKRETVDFLWVRNFLHEKYQTDFDGFDFGGGYAISEGNNKLVLKSEKLKKGDLVLVHFMNTKKGGSIEVRQGSKVIGSRFLSNGECFNKVEIKLAGYTQNPDQIFSYECATFVWAPVGSLEEDGELTIETWGDINIINAVASIPLPEYQNIVNSLPTDRILNNGKPLSNSKFASSEVQSSVSYERFSPTKYKVKISDLKNPTTLVFSEKHDDYWKLKNLENNETISSYPVYSQLNGFYVEKDGIYDLYFEPQKFVNLGFAISTLTLISILGYLLFWRRNLV